MFYWPIFTCRLKGAIKNIKSMNLNKYKLHRFPDDVLDKEYKYVLGTIWVYKTDHELLVFFTTIHYYGIAYTESGEEPNFNFPGIDTLDDIGFDWFVKNRWNENWFIIDDAYCL